MLLRSFQLSFSSLCLLALAIASVNAQQRPYPPEFVRDYVNECTAGRGDAVQEVCRCIIRRVQTKYSFETFQRINRQIEATGQIPVELAKIINACQAKPKT